MASESKLGPKKRRLGVIRSVLFETMITSANRFKKSRDLSKEFKKGWKSSKSLQMLADLDDLALQVCAVLVD